MRVVVANAGSLPTTAQMALALAPELDAYHQPFWVGEDAWLRRAPRIGRRLARRSLPAELAPVARACPAAGAYELARVALRRIGVRGLDEALQQRRNVAFDRATAPLVPPGVTLVSQYGASLATFERAANRGVRRVLDYPIANLEVGRRLLDEEARRRPLFADSISARLDRDTLARVAAEVQLADLVVVGSRFAADSFAGVVDRDRVAVAFYGVDTALFRPRPRPERPPQAPLRVLFAGQISQRKGVADVLDAHALLDPARFELTLVGPVVGSGRGLAASPVPFRHVPAVPLREMPSLYAQSDVLVLPSLLEGSAHVVLEAMACGVPVVVTPNAGADAVEDEVHGFVVPVGAPGAIAERLERLAADPELRVRMGAAAAACARALDWARWRREFRALVGAEAAQPVAEALR